MTLESTKTLTLDQTTRVGNLNLLAEDANATYCYDSIKFGEEMSIYIFLKYIMRVGNIYIYMFSRHSTSNLTLPYSIQIAMIH